MGDADDAGARGGKGASVRWSNSRSAMRDALAGRFFL
jgi:hypothetical protein